MAPTPYAELHCHTNFSFLDGASPADDLVERAVELGLTGLAVTDHDGLYGAVRFVERGRGGRPPPGHRARDRAARSGRRGSGRDRRPATAAPASRRGAGRRRCPRSGDPALPGSSPRACRHRPRPERARLPGHREPVKEDLRGIGERGPRAASRAARPLARSAGGACAGSSRGRTWPARRACRGSPRRSSPSTPRASSRCRAAATGRSPGGCGSGDRAGARAVAERYARLFGRGDGPATSGFFIELSHHLLARRRLARRGDRRRSPTSSACRSWSPTTSTTPGPRTASSPTS